MKQPIKKTNKTIIPQFSEQIKIHFRKDFTGDVEFLEGIKIIILKYQLKSNFLTLRRKQLVTFVLARFIFFKN